MSTPICRAATDADRDRHRRGESERARARDDEHGDGIDHGKRETWLGAGLHQMAQAMKGTASTTAGTNQPATLSASFWIGARLRWALATISTIWLSTCPSPTRSARMMNEPVPLTVPPVTFAPVSFATGMGSPVIMDSSTGARSGDDGAIDGNLGAGLDAQQVAWLHVVDGQFGSRSHL